MLGIKRSNRWLLLFLSSSALAVWGVILYQIIAGTEHDQQIDLQVRSEQKLSEFTASPHWYDESFIKDIRGVRDPFKLKPKPVTKVKPNPTHAERPKPEPPQPERPPDFAYVGYLSDGSASLALIQFGSGETRICCEGDSVKTAQLLEINKHKIKVNQEGGTHVLPLQR